MVKWCKEHNIVLTAYSPIANPGRRGEPAMLQHPAVSFRSQMTPSRNCFTNTKMLLKVLEAAKKYNKTPVQVLLNWGIARGYTGKCTDER